MQWRNEIEAHTYGMKVLIWHGSSRESDISQLKKYDVVSSIITSVALVLTIFRGPEHVRGS